MTHSRLHTLNKHAEGRKLQAKQDPCSFRPLGGAASPRRRARRGSEREIEGTTHERISSAAAVDARPTRRKRTRTGGGVGVRSKRETGSRPPRPAAVLFVDEPLFRTTTPASCRAGHTAGLPPGFCCTTLYDRITKQSPHATNATKAGSFAAPRQRFQPRATQAAQRQVPSAKFFPAPSR